MLCGELNEECDLIEFLLVLVYCFECVLVLCVLVLWCDDSFGDVMW